MQDKTIKLYAHPTCPMVPPVIALLKGAEADYDYINIHQDDFARDYVREVNNGYESVPTLLFPDGTTLTEPSTGELKNKLNEFGYDVPFTSLMIANLPKFLMWGIIGFAILRFAGVL
jgi:mycoredoxin